MICYFQEGLKPFFKIEIKQQNRESMNFEEMMQKTINVEANAGLRSNTMVRNLYIYCPRGHRPFNSTASKVKTKGTTVKNSHPEEPKVKEVKSPHPKLRRQASLLNKPARKKKEEAP